MELQDVFSSLKERIKHPFLGAFVTSFSAYNWRVWLFAVSGSWEPDRRITAIVGCTVGDLADPDFRFFSHPLVYAVVFTFAYPVLTGLVNIIYHWLHTVEENGLNWITEKFSETVQLKHVWAVQVAGYSRVHLQAARNALKEGKTDDVPNALAQTALKAIQDAEELISAISNEGTGALRTRYRDLEAMERRRRNEQFAPPNLP